MAKYGNTFMLMRSAGLLCCSSQKHLFYRMAPGSAWVSVSCCVKSCLTKCIASFEPIVSFDPIDPANPQGLFSSSWNALVQEPRGHKEWWCLALFVPITIFLIDSCEHLLSMSAALSCCFTDTFSSEELVLRDTTMYGCSYALPMSLNQGVKDSCVLSRAASLLVGSLL